MKQRSPGSGPDGPSRARRSPSRLPAPCPGGSTKDQLEVLLIHRPRYDDWSWPKGKIDAGETVPECAVREVRRGDRALSAPGHSAAAHPLPRGPGLKVVHYWAVEVNGATLVPDGKEVDRVMWCSAGEGGRPADQPVRRRRRWSTLRAAHDRGAAGHLAAA